MTPLLLAARTAPWVTLDAVSGGGDVVLLAPHPDDETLGCGGAIAALVDAGRRVQVVVMTDGCQSHPRSRSHPPEALRRLRAQEVTQALHLLTKGRDPGPVLLDYPDSPPSGGDIDFAGAVERVLPLITDTTTALWTTWAGDPHPDHGRTARVADRIAQLRPGLALWSYPVWGRFAECLPDLDGTRLARLDVRTWQDRKAKAVAAHASQMTGLIADDPGGFRMTDSLQQHFITTPELFLQKG
ncbi:MAG: PIG-L deacetylase family protein [Pseudotabrizicola sp.]|uniref:PIG-L deacetylase family protein n=1 Tax=Pseudotabrizicola sp. TaxID=2939647 RepID=UPI002717857D|nr:PIG-L deacetylase family protein [Pseudotabrizicola sp.]MDO9639903.1 PIG-L deacetylase family protein [Pseudotabrizicola sp.]